MSDSFGTQHAQEQLGNSNIAKDSRPTRIIVPSLSGPGLLSNRGREECKIQPLDMASGPQHDDSALRACNPLSLEDYRQHEQPVTKAACEAQGSTGGRDMMVERVCKTHSRRLFAVTPIHN
ncbi:hypothetical protein CIHG_07947 [Coccidioides immitis H538.4]|uniref:Uncharacterized protein n=1 Tax=Coccidioides immitis H538.4 TaxID=396776 RepID=A0A0J8RZD5_COCIT|nr:hypothetical protein CIHG_07947 [Coccidioides immitis H538.4]